MQLQIFLSLLFYFYMSNMSLCDVLPFEISETPDGEKFSLSGIFLDSY